MGEICDCLHQLFGKMKRHRFPFDEDEIPLNGIYILFEKGEKAHGGDRIVRIGTHTGKDQLRSRLKQHFINENKDRSIFRKNIGRAILNKGKDAFLGEWQLDLTTREAKNKYQGRVDLEKQKKIEREVSSYIQKNFSFVVFRVDDKDKRLRQESKIIGTVSLCKECGPSEGWLGLSSPVKKIRESGLWLVNELYKGQMSDGDVEEIRKAVDLSK